MYKFRVIIRVIVFFVLCISATCILNFVLIPNSIVRVGLHNIRANQYDDVFVGTSHGLSAINPTVIDQVTGRRSTSLCFPDEHLLDSYYLVKEACRTKKPKRIIYELDPSYWSTPQNMGANAVYIYNQFPFSKVKVEYFWDKIKEMDWRVTLTPWYYYRNCYVDIKKNIATKTSEAYKNYSVESLDKTAQMYTQEGYMYQVITPETDRGGLNFILWDGDHIEEKEEHFEKMVEYCKEQDVELVAITTPVPEETIEAYPEVYNKADEYFTDLMDSYDVEYYNFNALTEEEIDRSVEAYVDYEGHMSGELGNDFSAILGDYLNNIEE